MYLCSNFDHPIGTQKQAIFELTQNCYVQKENQIKERDCNHCVARSWCTKCTQVPTFMADYCDIMRHRTHVIDYIMAGLVYLDMTSSIPVLRNRKPEELKVTSEYMYNLTDPADTGSELPYFPKFSYLFTDGDAMHVLWSAASGKFFRISPQFALVLGDALQASAGGRHRGAAAGDAAHKRRRKSDHCRDHCQGIERVRGNVSAHQEIMERSV